MNTKAAEAVERLRTRLRPNGLSPRTSQHSCSTAQSGRTTQVDRRTVARYRRSRARGATVVGGTVERWNGSSFTVQFKSLFARFNRGARNLRPIRSPFVSFRAFSRVVVSPRVPAVPAESAWNK